jgi:hypothetical protein
VQHRQDALLQCGLHVDQQVAATDEVDARERRVREHVVPREDAAVADRLADPIAAFRLDEEPVQALLRHDLGDVLRVEAGTGRLDRGGVEVGGEDLQQRRTAGGLGGLGEGDGQ